MKNIKITKVIAYVIYAFFLINTIALVTLGAIRSILAYIELTHISKYGTPGFSPGIEIVESLDIFIIGMVFLVFTIGIRTLFIQHDDESYLKSIPLWMRVKNLTELKLLLMESIIVSLFIIFVAAIAGAESDDLEWKVLIIPFSILILAGSIWLVKKE